MRIEDNNFSVIKDQSVAPYNFVSLPSEARVIADKKEDLQSHGEINKEKYSGYIEYSIKNKTPLIIGKGKEDNGPIEFFKNPEGKYAIPGSTMRGLLRTNVAILSDSNISDDIEDGRFYYRSFGTDKLKKEYSDRLEIKTKKINGRDVLMPHQIRTGYIYKKSEDEYVLIPSEKVDNYPYIAIREQDLRKLAPKTLPINYMYNEKISELVNNKEKYYLTKSEKELPKDKQKEIKKQKEKTKRKFLSEIRNKKFKVSGKPLLISYKTNGKGSAIKIDNADKYDDKGYLMTSGYIANKLVHYIIPAKESDEEEISFKRGSKEYADIERYNKDLVVTKKASIKNSNIEMNEKYKYYGLPSEIGKENGKPIFFGKSIDSYYFGFTPYLRIPYDNNIKQGINENYKNKEGYSYVDKLFGFAKDNNSYKGLLSFEDCICITSHKAKFKNYNVILGEPHATSYNLYLKQENNGDNGIINYNDEFTIRGIKQYWIKDYITVSDVGNNANVFSKINAMDENNEFKGKIHFKNLSKEELGLVLWALKVDEKAHENIGMGKPYGFGHIVIDDIKVKTEDYKKKFLTMDMDCFIEKDKEEFINAYKNYLGDKAKSGRIEEFRKIKTNIIKREQKNMFRYMKISTGDKKVKNEFTTFKPFPDIKKQIDIIKKASTKQKQTKKNDFDDSPFAVLKGKIK